MKTRLILMACACLWAAAATGQIDPNSDGIGIYADVDGLTNEVELEIGVPMEVYLLLTRPSGPGGLGGWECSIISPDNIEVWGWNVSIPGAIVVNNNPGFAAGYPSAVPYEAANLLMTFIIVPLDSEPAQFYIEAYPYREPVDAPRYVFLPSGGGPNLIDMVPYPGGQTEASFTVNPVPTAVASATWGEMKALYR